MNRKIVIGLLAFSILSTSIMGCSKTNITENDSEKKVEVTQAQAETKGKNQEENVNSESTIPSEYQEIVSYLKNITGLKLPYFGGYHLNDQQIVVFGYDSDKAILWTGKDGRIQVIKASDIPEEKRMSSFADGEFNGVKTTFVAQESDPLQAFILAVHEGYHFYGQEWLDGIQTDHYIPRGTVYPENVQARLLMNAADQSLRNAVEGKDTEGAGKSLYFINKMRENNSEDLEGNLSTAIAEGSANFIENLFVAAAKNPELKSDMKALAKAAYEQNKANLSGSFHNKSSEYYQIASLPMYHFAMVGKTDVLDMIMQGKHGLELLAEETKPVETSIDPELEKSVVSYYKSNNEQAESMLEAFMAQSKSNTYAKILIPYDAFPGSMQFGDFINYKDGDQYKTVNTMTTADANLSAGKLSLINKDTANTDDYQYYLIYVKKSEIQADKTLNIDTASVKMANGIYTVEL